MQDLSSLDIYFWIKENKEFLIDSRIENIYENENLILQLYVPKKEKKYLYFNGFIFLRDEKEDIKENNKFGLLLRKHILNFRIGEAKQKEFERIIEIKLIGIKERKFLILELIKPYNTILCDENYKIIIAKNYKAFGSRLIRPGNKYIYPKKEFNILEINENAFVKAFNNDNSIVINLAITLGFGGKYSEEICERAEIEKKKVNPTIEELKKIDNIISKLKRTNIEPYIYKDKDNKILNYSPFELYNIKKNNLIALKEKTNNFNEAIKRYYYNNLQKKESKKEIEKKKINAILKNQEEQIKNLEKEIIENQKKAELIYENYELISNILNEIKNAMTKYSLKEIKEKLKDNKIIKEINQKEKTITIELSELKNEK